MPESLILNVVYKLMSLVLEGFLHDHQKDDNKIVIESYYPKAAVAALSGDVSVAASDTYSATFHFASILEVRLLFS